MCRYETMLVLRPDLSDDSRYPARLSYTHSLARSQHILQTRDEKPLLDDCRDVELAKFQSFLEREKASNIISNIRTVQQLAYPIAGYAYVGPDTCLSSILGASLDGTEDCQMANADTT